MKRIDPLQLQRLVDGELDDKQVQQILADAGVTPDRWQEIAIGFVENQTWSRAFQKQYSSLKVETGSAVGSHLEPESRSSELYPTSNAQATFRSTNFSWLVMAASLLVAATMGYMANQIQNRSLPGSSLVENVPPVSSPLLADNSSANSRPGKGSTVAQPQMTQADYHLEVPQEHLGELGSAGPIAPVPLFAANNVEQLKLLDRQRNRHTISPELLKQLTGLGYRMEQDISYFSGRLGDGRSFIVPVRTIRFMPGQ